MPRQSKGRVWECEGRDETASLIQNGYLCHMNTCLTTTEFRLMSIYVRHLLQPISSLRWREKRKKGKSSSRIAAICLLRHALVNDYPKHP